MLLFFFLQFLSSFLLTAVLYDLIGHQAPRVSVKSVGPRQEHSGLAPKETPDRHVCVPVLCERLQGLDYVLFTRCLKSFRCAAADTLNGMSTFYFFFPLTFPPYRHCCHLFPVQFIALSASGKCWPTHPLPNKSSRRLPPLKAGAEVKQCRASWFLWGMSRKTGRADAVEVTRMW